MSNAVICDINTDSLKAALCAVSNAKAITGKLGLQSMSVWWWWLCGCVCVCSWLCVCVYARESARERQRGLFIYSAPEHALTIPSAAQRSRKHTQLNASLL